MKYSILAANAMKIMHVDYRVRLAMGTMTLMSLSMATLGTVLYLKDQGAEGSTLLRCC